MVGSPSENRPGAAPESQVANDNIDSHGVFATPVALAARFPFLHVTVAIIMSQFWSPVVRTLSPYTPGEQPKIEGLIKLNTNENPYPPSPRVFEAVTAA
ncbi:MAG: hypothetical protein B7Z51_09670, partial [Methyloversatilis sp. 12-65-5]